MALPPPRRTRKRNKKPTINYALFLKYLAQQLVSLLLAPLLAFVASYFAYAITHNLPNLPIKNLGSIFYNCLYGDVLFSILSICIILLWDSHNTTEDDDMFVLKNHQKALAICRKICTVMCILMVFLAVFYKTNLSALFDLSDISVAESTISSIWFYDIVEFVSLLLCIITQGLSHLYLFVVPST